MGTDERIYTAADAQVDLMLNGLPEVSTLTPAQDIELRRMTPNGDGFIAPRQARAEARVAAELRSSNARLWKIMFGILGLFSLSWLGNAGLTAAVVILSKDLKVEGGTLKNNKDGGAVSTVSQKKVYEVTLLSPRRQLDEQGSGGTNTGAGPRRTVVAQATCASVLEAISSIEKGNDGSLVKMSVGDGKFWEPRMSAASYNLHDNSFGLEQIYLDDQRDESYDVTCEISMAFCKSTPDFLCGAVTNSEAISFGDAFDGDFNIPSSRRRLKTCKEHGDGVEDWVGDGNGHICQQHCYTLQCCVEHPGLLWRSQSGQQTICSKMVELNCGKSWSVGEC